MLPTVFWGLIWYRAAIFSTSTIKSSFKTVTGVCVFPEVVL